MAKRVNYETFSVNVHDNGVAVNILRDLPPERFLLALVRMRERIAAGEHLVLDDSDEIGDKHTHCSWGMCADEPWLWPDDQDLIWPLERRTVCGKLYAPLDRGTQHCPIDSRAKGDNLQGCFYTCRIFQAKHRDIPTREQVLVLYDKAIEELSK